MIITTLAVTQPKLSYTKENTLFYKEYSIGRFEDEKERCEFGKKYRDALDYLNCFVTMSRRVDVSGNSNEYREWTYYDFTKDIYSAALSFGDSDYYRSAKSCNRVHEQVMIYTNQYNALQKELTELNDRIMPCKHQSKSNIQVEYNSLFESRLKENRVYTFYLGKNQPGTPKQNKIDVIRKTTRLQYDVELARIETRIDVIRKELSNLKVENC